MTSFRELGVADELAAALETRGIESAFPIQVLTIPDALAGRDVCGKAKTGSGKTLAFGVPLVQTLPADEQHGLRGLVLVPTRELALQVRDEIAIVAAARDIRVVAIYGGAPIDKQISEIERGVDIVVATPGRMIDLLDRGAVSVGGIEHLVIDEADRMADMGFLPQVEWIMRRVERPHQTLLFSATLDGAVHALVERYQHDPVRHEVASTQVTVEEMVHHFLLVHEMDKVKVAAAIARTVDRTMMFTRTKYGADRLARNLRSEGVQAAAIHGDLRQSLRERALADFHAGRLQALVATDVASRGIHVDDVDVVVHFDPPQDHKSYLHRSGRTARAGAAGVVVTLLLWNEELEVRQLQRRVGVSQPIVEVFSNDPRLAQLATWVPDPSSDVGATA